MKKVLFAAAGLLALNMNSAVAQSSEKCGIQSLKEQLAANDPEFYQKQEQYFAEQRMIAEEYKASNTAQKSTAQHPIPVIFHIMLTATQIAQMGGEAGIAERCAAQIAQLNKDFNRGNADSTLIPAGFKPVYGNCNIQFGLAHTAPNNTSTPGYEIFTLPSTQNYIPELGGYGSGYAYSGGKYYNGVSTQWNAGKYLNVWVVNPAGGGLLGIAAPPSMTGNGGLPVSERGVLIQFGTLGNKNMTTTQYYTNPYNLGRTLTHEIGHYFEVWHVWGDDNGACPGSGGQDDGIADTPPQADKSFGSPAANSYQHDACSPTGNGYMYVNFMDYCNDDRSLMFTTQQAATMHTYIDPPNSESHSLTQHPELLQWPTGVSAIEMEKSFNVYPNPSSGKFEVLFPESPEDLLSVDVLNMLGQTVQQIPNNNSNIYKIDITGMSKGVYFVKCRFDEGTVTRKIVLE